MRRSCRSTDFRRTQIPAGRVQNGAALAAVGTPPFGLIFRFLIDCETAMLSSPVGDVENFRWVHGDFCNVVAPENSGQRGQTVDLFSVPFFASKENWSPWKTVRLLQTGFPFGETPRGAVPSPLSGLPTRQCGASVPSRHQIGNQNFIETRSPRARNDCPRWFNPMRVRTSCALVRPERAVV